MGESVYQLSLQSRRYIGEGIDHLYVTDIRFCAANAFFVIKDTELGFTEGVETLQRIHDLIPAGLARELAYTCLAMQAIESESYGLIDRLCFDKSTALCAASKFALKNSANSPVAVYSIKKYLITISNKFSLAA